MRSPSSLDSTPSSRTKQRSHVTPLKKDPITGNVSSVSPSRVHAIRRTLNNIKNRVKSLPPRYKYACLAIYLIQKVAMYVLVFYLLHSSIAVNPWYLKYLPFHRSSPQSTPHPLRVLYIVTSLAEYNTGGRKTIKGQDRLAEVLLPVLVDGLESMTTPTTSNIKVDVVLILAYKLRPERDAFIRQHLPAGVGLQVWDDALPLGYDPPLHRTRNTTSTRTIKPNTRALARQHRYVIRDKFLDYDLFIAVEDDMRITGSHVQHYMATSAVLDHLRERQQASSQQGDDGHDLFFGPLTVRQLNRMIPGFVRVEVLLNETEHGAQTELDPIPLDYSVSNNNNNTTTTRHFDPTVCCSVQSRHYVSQNATTTTRLPARPTADQVVIWETNIKALSVRQMPPNPYNYFLDWVALLPGPGKRLAEQDKVLGYWSGQDGAFGKDAHKPSGGDPHVIAQQGGWMATQSQILRFQDLCQGNFLPPYDAPIYHSDGQESMNVEFWSGGYQLFTGVKGGCNLQRVVSLHPDHFGRHFIYHAANNKQRQLPAQRMLRADHLWGQLNSVRKAAERAQAAILRHQTK